MPELWENCNYKSRAVLIQLYWDEHGCYPDFYYLMKGEMRKPDVINAPDYQEEEEIEIEHEMSRPPSQQRRVE